MTPDMQTEYIVQCIREGASMYEEDARKFLAEHDTHIRAEVEREVRAQLIAGFRSVAADISSAVPPIEAGPRTEFERGLMVGARSVRLHADELEAGEQQ